MSTPTPVRPPAEPGPVTPQPGPRPAVGVAFFGVVLIAAGVLWLLAALGIRLPVAFVTPVILASLGVAVIVSALRGENHPAIGLAIFAGVWLAVVAFVTAAIGVPLTGAVGDRELVPVTVEELDASYRLFAGSQTLDLRDLELPPGTTSVELSTVLGEIDVRVPAGTAVRIDAATAVGAIDIDDTLLEGVRLGDVRQTEGWDAAATRLDLELRVGLGEVRVGTG